MEGLKRSKKNGPSLCEERVKREWLKNIKKHDVTDKEFGAECCECNGNKNIVKDSMK